MDKLAEGYTLIEGPIWVPGEGLLFSDVMNGGVFCLDASGEVSTVFGHRKGIGGMSLHENGGMIVSGRNISWKSIPEGETVTVFDRDESEGRIGFNDITTDSRGRVYAGSLGSSPVMDDGRKPQSGNLYLIDLDGSVQQVAEDIRVTNGLGFSPDGKRLYHSDSGRNHINTYTVNDDGTLGEKEVFATDERTPDGLCVAEDGNVFAALANGSGVAVFSPQGSMIRHIEIPKPMCTSLCFGGDDLKDLYIVCGSNGTDSDNAGDVYVTRQEVAGLEVMVARIALG
jgi:D-xylonolactonase